jgi:ParB-like chromosome segregation protein Spo0J
VPGELDLIAPSELRPHEDVDAARVESLIDEIRAAGFFYPPVLIDRATRVILDGHHRWHASTRMGLRVMPCFAVDYVHDPLIRVMSRRPDVDISKESVLATALAGRTYPHKTTRHMYDLPEWLEPVALDRLLHD